MQSFWNSNSDIQHVADELSDLVPARGSVPEPRKNKALERFRRATNCYYDLYNNGLDNRRQEFYRLFKVRVSDYYIPWKRGREIDFDRIMPVVEPIMRDFVLAAAREQGIER